MYLCFVCVSLHPHVTRMYWYVTIYILVCTRMYPYVTIYVVVCTRMYAYVTCMYSCIVFSHGRRPGVSSLALCQLAG